jgi:hypothetical protein
MGMTSGIGLFIISVVELKDKRSALKERFAAILQVKIEISVPVQGYVKVVSLEN